MSKPITIHDVAGALGMHKSTVSLALSGKGNVSAATRSRVLSVARELGYEPNLFAQRLATGHQNSTICIFSGVLDVGLATTKVLMIQKELNRRCLDAPIYTCLESPEEPGRDDAAHLRQLCRQRPRAIVCTAQFRQAPIFAELDVYQKAGGIVICYDHPAPLACDQVIFNREDNAYQAARCLLRRGHRHLGFGMSNRMPWLSNPIEFSQPHRLSGFQRALQEFGVSERPEWFFQNAAYEQGGAEMARTFLELRERPTGLCIVNDYSALAFMVEVMRAGVRIPQDVSIIGHDNQPIASYCPVPLTSLSHPVEQIAQAVVGLLLARLDGSQEPPQTVMIAGQLTERESVGAPPAARDI